MIFQGINGPVARLSWDENAHLSTWSGRAMRNEELNASHVGFVMRGPSVLLVLERDEAFQLETGAVFRLPGPFVIEGGEGVVLTKPGRFGLFTLERAYVLDG
jgi:hypothetical protein